MSGLPGGEDNGTALSPGVGPRRSSQEIPLKGLTSAARAQSIMSAEPPSRRAAEPPSRRAAEPPSRRAAEPPSRRAAGHDCVRRVVAPAPGSGLPPPESSSAGRRPDARRPASSTDSLDPCAARAGTGVRHGVLRLRRALRPVLACALLAGALLAGLPAGAQAQTVECTAANADGSYNVPTDWALKPSSLAVGTKFRLLFVSSTRRNADSFFIRDYNTFVQTRAKAGHSAISDSCGNRFKVVASTTFHARDNTMTRSTDTGASIHWLSGAKVADDYADFYDGDWDSYAGRQEAGSSRPMENIHVFTGSYANGTSKHSKHIGATYFDGVRRGDFRPVTTGSNGQDGEPRTCTGGPIDSGCTRSPTVPGHFYGLSPVFTVIDGRVVSLDAATYEVDEGDAVSVTLNVKWPQSTATTVGITCTHGTTSAADFTACPATVTIPANAGTHAFDIPTTRDARAEGDETFVVAISSVPSGFRTGTPPAATVHRRRRARAVDRRPCGRGRGGQRHDGTASSR